MEKEFFLFYDGSGEKKTSHCCWRAFSGM